MKPSISVIIAAHNAEAFLWETLASLQRQRFTDYEIIVVDDGSTDGTRTIATRPQCRVIALPRSGVSLTRNAGLAAARAPFILFLDADDVMPQDALGHLFEALTQRPDAVAAVAQHLKFWPDHEETPEAPLRRGAAMPEANSLKALLRRNFIVNGGTLLIRTEAARAVGGFNPHLRLGEDWDFWCRLALLGDFAVLRETIVLHYRQRADGAQHRLRGTPFRINDDAVVSIFSDPHIRARLTRRELWLSRRQARQDSFWSEARAHLLRRHYASFGIYLILGLIRYPETVFKLGQFKRYWRGAETAFDALRQARR